MAITTTVSLAISMEDFESFNPMQSQNRFCETHEDAAKSCESEVDMVISKDSGKNKSSHDNG